MKSLLLAALLAVACAPPPSDSPGRFVTDPNALPSEDGGVQVIQQALTVSVRPVMTIDWVKPWGTILAQGTHDPEQGDINISHPAENFMPSPDFNLCVTTLANPNQCIYGVHMIPNSVTFSSLNSCGIQNHGGYIQSLWAYPYVTGLQSGVTYKFFFMLRCSSGGWPAYGPPSGWSFNYTVPSSGSGPFQANFTLPSMWNGRTWWKDWFNGCGGEGMGSGWINGVDFVFPVCHQLVSGCQCDNGNPPGEPINNSTVLWQ